MPLMAPPMICFYAAIATPFNNIRRAVFSRHATLRATPLMFTKARAMRGASTRCSRQKEIWYALRDHALAAEGICGKGGAIAHIDAAATRGGARCCAVLRALPRLCQRRLYAMQREKR